MRPLGRMWWAQARLAFSAILLGACALRVRDPQSDPDAFYTPPAIVTRNPGDLIRSETLVAGVPDGARAWRILYTTTNADGSPAVASGIVIAPITAPPGPRPVIAVAHGTTGIAPRCAPSLSEEPFSGGARAALEQMIAKGWVGVISDYVGLGTRGPHPYLVGESEARNILDAVRAAHKLQELDLDMRTVVWGHSQGGHGALWTGIVAPAYASEFKIIGIAAMAPASDLQGLADGLKGSTVGKVVMAYIADAWSKVYPDLGLATIVTPESEPTASRIGELCFVGRGAITAIAMGARLTDPVLRDSTFNGRVGELLRANTPTRVIAAPVLIAQGDADRLVLPAIQRRFVADRCAAGQALEYRVYAGKDHVPLVASDSPLTRELVAWTEARLAGQSPTNSC